MKYFKTVTGSTLLMHSLFDLMVHLLLCVLISLIIYWKSHNLSYVAFFVSGGIFIDLDHFIDYALYSKSKFNIRDFFSCVNLKSGKVYLFFHSWEINILLFLLGTLFNSRELLFLVLGLSVHLAVDNLQRKNPWAYFLFYRISRKFAVEVLLPEFKN